MNSHFLTDGVGVILAKKEKAKLCLFRKTLCKSPKITLD